MDFDTWFKEVDRAFSRKWGGVSLTELTDIDYYSLWEDLRDEPLAVSLEVVEEELAVQDDMFGWVYGGEDE